MTQARATKRRTRLEKKREHVLGDLVDGLTQEEVAAKYGVNPSSVHRFAYKYAEQLTNLSLAVEQQAEHLVITNKVWRLGELQGIYGEAKASAIETEDPTEKATMLKTAMSALHGVAEELGALPRPDQNINLKAAILIRQIEGTDLEAPS